MVVDDDEAVRSMLSQAIGALGFDVLTVSNGREAVAFYRQHLCSISLVLLDLIMPDMDGRETYHAIRQLDPKARVLISSGYHPGELVDDLLARGAIGFLPKPYDVDQLAEKLAAALRG